MIRNLVFLGSFFCVSFLLAEEAAPLEFTRDVATAPSAPSSRERYLGKTWIYAERQPYAPHQNFMHYWIDRPLFTDTSLREETNPAKSSFLKDVEVLKNYGIDGFGSLAYFNLHLDHLRYLKEAGISDYSQMIILPSDWVRDQYENIKDMIIKAAKSPYTTRLDGKLVLWYYGAPRHTEELAKKLRQDKDIPPFYVFGALPFLDMYNAFYQHKAKGQEIPAEKIEQFREKISEALNVFDGLTMRLVEPSRTHDGEYAYHAKPTDLYRKYLLPITLEIMKQPQYEKKLLGACILHSYVNHLNGPNHGEYGTEKIRAYFDEAILCNPDILMLFEWNEANENTSFQPTVANGRAIERVVNYYKAILNREKPAPRPGDDTTIPNLVLSARQTLRIGEPYHIELLSIPDGTPKTICKANIILKSASGKIIGKLPQENIPSDALTAYSYNIPSEQFAGEVVVQAELDTEFNGEKRRWSAFDATRIRTTTEWNYKYTRHALREILPVDKTSFSVELGKNGDHTISGMLKSSEKLASLEVIDSGEEVAASDPGNEFDRDKYHLFRGTFSTMFPDKTGVLKGEMEVSGSANWKLRSAFNAWETFFPGKRTENKMTVRLNTSTCRSVFLLSVPKNEMQNAKLIMDYDKIGHAEFDLPKIHGQGKESRILPSFVRLDLERMDDLADYPRHINKNEAEIKVSLHSANKFPIYQMRAISVSGKIYRSAPIVPRPPKGNVKEIEVYSETKHAPVKINVYSEQIPDLKYCFNPVYGAWLTSGYESRWDAKLGGGWVYSEPMMNALAMKSIPNNFQRPDPVWSEEEGRCLLQFDGNGSYLVLPIEAIPRSSVFTIDFEIKSESHENQVLFRSTTGGQHSAFQLIIEDGCLKGSYFGLNSPPGHFATGLHVAPNQWSKIQVVKDFNKISFAVNGMTKAFPYDKRGCFFQSSTFGGNLAPAPGIPSQISSFKGKLRSLRIYHGTVDLSEPTEKSGQHEN